MKTAAQALAFVRKHRLVMLSAHVDALPCFADEVAGARIAGSWWGHPKGKLIYALAEGLEDSERVLSMKLLQGKTTFVDRALWPAVLAVVLDDDWRKARRTGLSAAAKALWKKTDAGSCRGEAAAPVKQLEERLLVHVASEHTEKGRHEKRLTSWAGWAKAQRVKPAKISVEVALQQLREAAQGTATALER